MRAPRPVRRRVSTTPGEPWPRPTSGDEGQILLLSIGYLLLALLLVTAVVSASSVHLERKRLLALADLTALAAATALDDDAYYRRTGADATLVPLSDASVRTAALDHLAGAPEAGGLEALTLVAAGTADGRTATVTLAARARPPLLGWVTAAWSDGIGLRVTASARAG